MPLIPPEKKVTNEHLKLNLPSDSLQELRAYGKFLNNSSLSYVLTQLLATLGRDKEFQQWKAAQNGHAPESPTGNTREYAHGKTA